MQHRLLSVLLLLTAAVPVAAQTSGQPASARPRDAFPKRALTQADWDRWRSISAPILSPDGRWAAYTLTPQVGDGELVLRATNGPTERRVPRGYTGRVQLQPNADSGFSAPPAQFDADSRFLAALTFAPMAEFERARRSPRRGADQPRAALAIVPVDGGNVVSVPRVRSFRMPRERGGWIAYLLEGDDSVARAARDTTARGRRAETGTTLVLRNLASGQETRIPDVTGYVFEDSARWLGYTVASRDRARNGVYLHPLGVSFPPAPITVQSDVRSYRALASDRSGHQLAFVAVADSGADSARATLWHARVTTRPSTWTVNATEVLRPRHFGDTLVIAERVEFTRPGNAIVFGLAYPPRDSIPADSLVDKAIVDLWHWKDERLQSQQRLESGRERSRTFTAVYHLDTRRAARLADADMPQVTLTEDARVAVGTTQRPYAIPAMWGEGATDVYLVNGRTGARTEIARKLQGFQGGQLSPSGRHVVFFRDGRWHGYTVATGRTVDLTGRLAGVRFDEETTDTPSTPSAYGVAGWTTGDRSVLVYDRWDIWELDPTGARAPRVVTDSAGRRMRTSFRIANLDPERRTIEPAQQLTLRAFDDETKGSGYWTDRVEGAAPPVRITMADASLSNPIKARRANVYLARRGTFTEFPDLYAGERLDALTRISEANPQQKDVRWGTVELVRWRTADGIPTRGLLYKPEGFDPTKQYPMVVYFYEQHTDSLHQYHPPFGRNVVVPSHYASNGYLVFEPDVVYTEGFPGPSALKTIVPGVQALVDRGFVDPNGIGIQGQSWGGYQTAYIITQSRLFRAAMAGAPVSNMTSAYGGIRWESGNARPGQYEHGQSRIGGSMWQYQERFVENSPIFFLDRVQTPLLIMHNDADGAVPWQEGIQLFIGLRRLGKEAYLLNYNNDGHNPRKRANQKDVARRMEEFFDHHLRGAPMPAWMKEGIPYRDRGRDQLGGTRDLNP